MHRTRAPILLALLLALVCAVVLLPGPAAASAGAAPIILAERAEEIPALNARSECAEHLRADLLAVLEAPTRPPDADDSMLSAYYTGTKGGSDTWLGADTPAPVLRL